jgi:trigger factor
VPSTLKNVSPVTTELSVEISEEDVNKALEKAYAKLGRTAQIKGFRKGRVPRAVLKRMFSEAVQNEVRGDLVADHFAEALKEHGVEPVSQPDMNPEEMKENEPYSFSVTFETRQKIDKINLEDIEIEKHKITIKPEDVEKELERLRSTMAEVFELEEPRAAAQGDLARLNIKRWIDGEWQEGAWTNRDVVIGETAIEKEVEEILIGMNVDEEKVVELGGDAGEEAAVKEVDKEKERARYLVKLIMLRGRKLADLDDEFAKDLGDYETLDDLKKNLEERLEENGKKGEDQRLMGVLFDAIREKNPMELPPSLIERQKMALVMRLQSSLAMIEKDGPAAEDRDKIFARAESAANEMVHQHLLILECAEHNDVKVEDADIDGAIAEIAAENGYPEPMVKAEFAKDGRRDELANQLLEKKIFDLMLPKVKIKEIDPPTEPEKSAEDEGA